MALDGSAAGPLAPRLADDAPGHRTDARTRPSTASRRCADRGGLAACRGAMKWWGWGDPAPSSCRRRPCRPCARSSASRARDARAGGRPRSRCPRRSRCPSGGRRGRRGEVLDGAEDRIRHADRPRLSRPRPPAHRPARGRSRRRAAPGGRRRVRRVLDACAAEGVAVVPFGGGTSVVGGSSRCAAATRPVSLDLSRLRSVELDSPLADRAPGPGPERARRPRRPSARGADPRPLPAVLRIGDDRRFRRDPFGGPGLERLRPLRRDGHRPRADRPGGPAATLETPHTAAGPSLRELVMGSEGMLGVITDVTCRVRPAPRVAATRAGSRRASRPAGRSSGTRPGPEAPDVCGSPTRRRPRSHWARRHRGAFRKRASTLSLAPPPPGWLSDDLGWEGERGVRGRRRSLAARGSAGGARSPLGRRPGTPGTVTASGGPYLRDELMNLGVLVETLETAHTWSTARTISTGRWQRASAAL